MFNLAARACFQSGCTTPLTMYFSNTFPNPAIPPYQGCEVVFPAIGVENWKETWLVACRFRGVSVCHDHLREMHRNVLTRCRSIYSSVMFVFILLFLQMSSVYNKAWRKGTLRRQTPSLLSICFIICLSLIAVYLSSR